MFSLSTQFFNVGSHCAHEYSRAATFFVVVEKSPIALTIRTGLNFTFQTNGQIKKLLLA
jgi:hypothetical protein